MISDVLSDASGRILDYLEIFDYTDSDFLPQIAAVLLAMDRFQDGLDSAGLELVPGAVARSFPTDPLAYLEQQRAERAAEREALNARRTATRASNARESDTTPPAREWTSSQGF
jgi:hypothetical protein